MSDIFLATFDDFYHYHRLLSGNGQHKPIKAKEMKPFGTDLAEFEKKLAELE